MFSFPLADVVYSYPIFITWIVLCPTRILAACRMMALRGTLRKHIINIPPSRPTCHIHQILHFLNLVVHLVFGTSPHLHTTASSSAPPTQVLSHPPHPEAFKFLFAHPIVVRCPRFEHIIIFPIVHTHNIKHTKLQAKFVLQQRSAEWGFG
jgi:hypothetical protein